MGDSILNGHDPYDKTDPAESLLPFTEGFSRIFPIRLFFHQNAVDLMSDPPFLSIDHIYFFDFFIIIKEFIIVVVVIFLIFFYIFIFIITSFIIIIS